MQAGAEGIKILIKGRIAGREIARQEKLMEGRVPLHTLRADIDYDSAEARTMQGCVGVKVWIYKGGVLPPEPAEVDEELKLIEVTIQSDDTQSDDNVDAAAETT